MEPKRAIFVSFPLTLKERVSEFVKRIEDHTRKGITWTCTEQIFGGEIMDRNIVKAISEADIILCVINQQFVDSAYCQDEALLSREKNKHIIPVLFEKVDWPLKMSDGTDSPLQRIFANRLYINMYNQEREAEQFQKLIETIKKYTDVREQGSGGQNRENAGDSRDGREGQNDRGNAGDSRDGGEEQNDRGKGGADFAEAFKGMQNTTNVNVSGQGNNVQANFNVTINKF